MNLSERLDKFQEQIAEKIAERVADKIPDITNHIADSIINELGDIGESISKGIIAQVSGSIRDFVNGLNPFKRIGG
ncbi:Uncharacterised protein [Mycobacteroides abscessus subsp. abscessus]|uniref:hypothetical protein n=1 Tax=Mycobacteroides abscessus TaxID=36809 RepID=UPI0009263B87|nr:hypothetical protein [Mycobacteroides abscessus]SIL71524.1 Uncharacterised protein [Mycobacteroides abscessus subsp. abscessus]